MADNEINTIGLNIKKIFRDADLSQQDVAEILNVTQSIISKWLNGKPFGKNVAKQWEEAFGFRQNWLLTGEGDIFTSDSPKVYEYKKGDNYGNVSASQGNATGVINGGVDMRTYQAEKIIRKNGDTELYGDAQSVIERLELENASLKQRVSDLENLLLTKDALIESLQERILIFKSLSSK